MPTETPVMPKQEVLNKGDPNCKHSHVHYVDNPPLDGKAYWCDACPRHERIKFGNTAETYGRHIPLKFPAGALIRPIRENVYQWKADVNGIVQNLPPFQWKKVESGDLTSRL